MKMKTQNLKIFKICSFLFKKSKINKNKKHPLRNTQIPKSKKHKSNRKNDNHTHCCQNKKKNIKKKKQKDLSREKK